MLEQTPAKPKFHTQVDMEPSSKERVNTLQSEELAKKGGVNVTLKFQNQDYPFKFDKRYVPYLPKQKRTTCK